MKNRVRTEALERAKDGKKFGIHTEKVSKKGREAGQTGQHFVGYK